MDLGIPPLKLKNLLESNPLQSRCPVREVTVRERPKLHMIVIMNEPLCSDSALFGV